MIGPRTYEPENGATHVAAKVGTLDTSAFRIGIGNARASVVTCASDSKRRWRETLALRDDTSADYKCCVCVAAVMREYCGLTTPDSPHQRSISDGSGRKKLAVIDEKLLIS